MWSTSHLLTLLLSTGRVVLAGINGRCRCLYGDSCWPIQSDFDQLAAQVSQPLILPLPPASPCHASVTSPECAAVQEGWRDGNWRADQPGAMQESNFETFVFPNGTIEACFLNTTLAVPCGQGSVSVIGVDARSVSDIQAAVKFAASHNLRVAVKNTGHDFLGRSNGRGSFVIWTHHLKNITVHTAFHPTGAPSDETYDAMTLEAGVQWHEAYDAANATNRMLVGGLSAGGSVGAAGGWLLGGGHSALAPAYGLGVDNVVQVTVVTSTGQFLVTNAHQHADLFWALRGGGGGTFGVVASVTYHTRPMVPVVAAFLVASINGTRPNAALSDLFTEIVRLTPALTDAGWGGYTILTPSPATDSLSLSLFSILPNASLVDANTTAMTPLLAHAEALNATGGLDLVAAFTQPFPSWYMWYTTLLGQSTADVGGVAVELGSWLLPRDAIERDHEHVAQTLLEIDGMNYYLVAGGAVSRQNASSTGLNPAWRKAVAHAVGGVGWPEGTDAATIGGLRETLQNNTAKLRALAPESGAYFNEASLYEPDPAHSFFGAHYGDLRAVKAVYDPIDLFVVTEGVGSAEWDKDLRCRV